MTADPNLATRIRAFLALADASTPGPWSIAPCAYHGDTTCTLVYCIYREHSAGKSTMTQADGPNIRFDRVTQDCTSNESDAAFIASAPAMASLLRELLPVLEDAERYRWLREQKNDVACVFKCTDYGDDTISSRYAYLDNFKAAEELDAAIDAEIVSVRSGQ